MINVWTLTRTYPGNPSKTYLHIVETWGAITMESLDPIEEWKQEADAFLIQLEETLLNLEQSPDDADLVDRAFGLLHSLKGAGMTFGWEALAAFVHQVETTFVQIRNGMITATPELIALALLATDHMRTLFEQPENLEPTHGTTLLAAMAKLADEQTHADPSETSHVVPVVAREVLTERPTLRVPLEQLNQLMDQVVALSGVQARLSQAIESAGSHPMLQAIGSELERVSANLRNTTTAMRMLPISVLFRRFRRVVHDLSRELGKSIALTLSGESTALDKFILNELYAPLLHLVRNAVDHGIESSAERIALGKPVVGRLRLGARCLDEDVIITLEDDGRGLNAEAIRAKAVASGLLTPDQEISTAALFDHIFCAGFSTATQVTTISGRGVGMEVVKRAIDNLHGTIELMTTPSQGTSFLLRFPRTLATLDERVFSNPDMSLNEGGL